MSPFFYVLLNRLRGSFVCINMKNTGILFSIFVLLACSKPHPKTGGFIQSPNDTVTLPTDTLPAPTDDTAGIKTFLALGDSYTYGESVAENQKLPYQIAVQLNGLGITTANAEVIARTGWTTGNLLSSLNDNPPALEHYSIVTLLIGVNNQFQGGSQELYKKEFASLLDKAIAYAGDNPSHVFVLSIPDWGVTPFASNRNRDLIAKQIDSFNIINKQITLTRKANYTDVTDISRLAASNPSLIAVDGLHPSGEQYRMWANRLVTTIRAAFY